MMDAHAQIGRVERDVAPQPLPGGVEAAVEAEAQRGEDAQRVVVGAEITGAEGGRSGRPGTRQYVAGEGDQFLLRCEREIADIAAA